MGKDGDPGGEATQPKPLDPKMQAAKVHMLDGTIKEFALPRGSKGDTLFTMVSTEISIEEHDYFSLAFHDSDGVRHWLYTDKKILRQLKGLPWVFSFEVKFYPTSPSTLNDDHARYNLFLQLRNDIYSGRLPATIPTHVLLGSLVAQAEFGDASTSAEYEQYLRTAKLAPRNNDLIEKIKDAHNEHKGLTPSEAEIKYLDTCKQLSMYGVFVFDAKDKSNNPVSIGICATGINIYKETIRLHRFLWQSINKISYRKNTFAIKLNPGEVDKKTLVYKVSDYTYAKRTYKCGVEHHTFFRLIQPEDKPKQNLFRWGSARFRYNGRTQFQTKMASHMFDRPVSTTVQRSNSARLTQSCDNVAKNNDTVNVLGYSEKELGSSNPLSSPVVSYEVSNSAPGSTKDKVREELDSDDDELVYTPIESPTSAAYYISESSLRSPHSAKAVSPYRAILRVKKPESNVRRNLFGRDSTQSVRLVSFHEPADPLTPLSPTKFDEDLPHLPISDSVQLYHHGYYNHSIPSPTIPIVPLPYQNGHNRPNQLRPQDDLESHPIRYFVNVRHSGQQAIRRISRTIHPGVTEDATPDLNFYNFPSYNCVPLMRLEKSVEIEPKNLREYSNIYWSDRTLFDFSSQLTSDVSRSQSGMMLGTEDNRNMQQKTSRLFPFISRKRKSTDISYPVSDKYEGPLDDVEPLRDLENLPFENIPQVAYSPKKVVAVESSVSEPETEERRFRLIARIRHDGEEDVVDKEQVNPEHYGIASTSYDGPLEETSRENELESAPLKDHTNVYHHGMSGIETKTVVEPTKGKKKAILHLKAGPSTTSETEEKPEIRLIARIAPDETETTPEKTSTKTRESSKRFGFLKSGARKSKTAVETSTYPVSDKYEGPLDDVEPLRDLENLPFEIIPQVAYSPKKVVAVESSVSEPETEERRFRLIARIRHDGEEDVVDKEQVNPEHYGIASTSYDGPLEETSRENELESAPLKDHTNVYHHGMSGIETKTVVEPTKGKKKAILHLKAGPSTTSETEEKPEIRLIARIAPDETETTPEKTSTKTRESSKRFGFLKSGARKSKTAVETSTYPVSDKYEGPLDDVEPLRDLENLPFENIPQVAYSPKKVVAVESSVSEPETEERRFRLIARIRHDGEEDVVDKEQVNPEHYGIASTSYDGPLEETSRENELESAPLKDHTNVYHHGMSGIETKTVVEPTKGKKKAILHLKAGPSTTSETEEKPEIRLIARIAPDETETTPEKTSTKTRESSKRFGFLKSGARKSKTAVETSTYPVSDKYEGPLDDVEPLRDLENLPFENIPQVAYSPKKVVAVESSVSEPETEERRFRLIARIRHDGEEDVVDKEQVNPEHYGIASTSYDGPLEETSRENELESAPLKDHTNVYHHGMSGIETNTVVEPAKGKKKAILHLKAGPSTTSETEEKPEIRLIARIAPDETETTPEKTSTKTRESSKRFGFLKSGARKSKTAVETSTYPVSDKYEGPLDDVEPLRDLENLPFENIPQVAYSPKKVVAVESSVSEPETEERRFRLIARIRHDGEEDVVDKEQVNPEHYGIASTSYDGPLEETSRENELESAPLKDHTNVYHHGMSGIETNTVVEPAKGKKKAILHLKAGPSTTSETEEKPEIRLIARIAPDETETTPEKTSTKTRESSKRFGFLKSGARKSKTAVETSTYPVSDKYEGPLDDVEPLRDLENLPFENIPQVAYSPKKVVAVESSVSEPETEERRFRLIARIRHDGEEDVVDKEQVNPEHYGIASTSYDGPLEETSRENELESASLKDHTNVYHHGMSGIETKTVVEPTKGKKKAILHLKAGPSTTSETEEKPEIRLIARIAPDETETTPEKTSTKTRESSKRFGFLKSGARKSKTAVETSTYPVSDKYEGPLDDVEPLRDLENLPFENIPQVAYSPKKVVAVESSVSEPETEERRFRLIARIRHDGEEDVVDKEQVNPEHYGIASTSYDGPLEETSRENELESAPLKDHTNVYHHGMSGIETNTVVEPAKGKKKAILHLKAGPSTTSETEEKPEIRLIARIAPDETETTPEKTSTKTRESSKRFGFLKSGARKSKTAVETSTYPVSDKYEGPLDDVEPLRDLENLPFENIPQVAYSPKKVVAVESSVSEPETEERRFRLIARIRHDGEEDVVDKEQVNPEHYGIASTSYDGPLEETSRENELESAPLKDHTNVYHHGMSGIETNTVVEPAKGKKKAILHLKAGPSTTSETEEKPEIRLIARIAPDETETTPEKTSTKTRESSKRFGFLKSGARKSKTAVETSTYPVSDKYEGPLDDVEPLRDLENLPFENIPQVAYSPKKVVAVESSVSEPETEERRFRLIARIRHDGEEDVVDKEQVNPEHYGIASTSYDGPLEETSRENELESAPLKDHTNVYHHGMSGIETKTVVEPTKGKKKAILHLKAGPSTTSETEEKPEIRLIARIAPDETETTPEKTSTKTRESSKRFGFLKSGARKSKTAVETSTYPVSDKYEGPLDDVEPLRDLENLPFENIPQVAYSPKKVVAVESSVSEPETEERRFRLIARIRHDGEEDVVDKEQVNPEHYGIASTSYDGPLEETSRENELESAPLNDHTNVYHHGMSGIETKTVVEPTKGKKKAILHLKAGPSTTSETEEKPEIRLIARIAPDETETTPEKTSTKTRESSKRFGFLKSGARKSKTAVETSTYPVSDKYEGPLDDVEPLRDLENLPFENIPQVAYSPKKVVAVESSVSEPETEERRFRLIARIRHDGEEDVVDKEQVNPEHYGIASTSYDGPLEETSRENELESAPLNDHTNVYHHGMSGIETKTVVEPTKGKKKAILHLKAGPSTTSETEEKPEIRLIARIAPDETETTPEKTSTKTRESSKRFGFLKSGARKSKTAVETSTYPVSDKYEGPLDDVEPLRDLENLPFENIPQVAYSPKKVVAVESSVSEPETEERRFRLIARIRHDGEEDVVDKEQVNPEHYGIASTSYDGPLEETSRENELESAPLKDHTNVYHHGMSGIETNTVVEPAKGKKKAILHLKAGPSTTSETEEKPEIRLIARIAPDETETTPEKTSTKTRESSKRFGFLKSGARKSKTAVETSTYPVSDKYEGPLDDVEPLRDLENLPFENIPQVAYSPKKVVAVESSVSEPETEERRFRLIARIRHDGEEDVVDKEQVNPEHYGIASTSYDGPLEETSRENELESAPLKDHTNVYHHGMSGIETKTVVEPTKGKKKAILHLKAGPSTTSETEEKPEIRLIARIAPDETETTPEKTSTKTRESSKRFGFLKSGARKSKTAVETSTYPVSDKYEGPLDDVEPLRDLENLPFENIPQVAYSPKKVVAVESSVSEPETEERRFRLIARIRHDGEEDVVDKEQVNPEHYGIASTSYDGPLEETSRENELESAPLKDHTNVYHHGMSGIETKTVVEPTKGKKKAVLHLKAGPSTTSETEEKPEIRLIARIAPDETETTPEKTSTKTRESSKRFGFLKSGARKSKTAVETSTYPVSDKYEGPLDDVEPLRDLENLPFENIPQVAYSPKKVVAVESSVSEPETEERRFRLIARIRHDGEEDVVDKEQVNPEHYGIASTSYDGPLEETSRENELESAPLKDHTNVYHHGMSGIETKTVVEPTKGKKKAVLHLKAGPSTTSETEEKPEIRLIARIAPDETETTPEKTSTKTRESSKRFGFLKSGARKSKTAVETSTYPVSDKYEGPLDDVEPLRDLENLPFENIPQVAYSPKKVVAVESSVSEPETEERRFRLIARIRHDGEEDVVDKEQVNPEHYGIASTSYDGPLEETSRENELESAPLKDHTNVYHHGMSGIETKTVVEPTKGKKKAILHLKAGPSTTSETEEKPEIRLIARIAPDETETTPEKTSTKTRESSKRFGFLKSGARKSKTAVETSTYPVSDKYEGPLDDVEPLRDLENLPFENIPQVAYSPKKVVAVESSVSEPETEERRFRLIARIRHDGEEDVVDKEQVNPEHYGIASTSYDGPLEETSRENELESAPLKDHTNVYHHGMSGIETKTVVEPTKGKKKAVLHLKAGPSTTSETEEKPEIRLIARIAPDETETTPEKTSTKTRESSKRFGFLKSGARKSKTAVETSTYPVSDKYEGPLDDVEPLRDLENLPFENIPQVAYSPKKVVAVESSVSEPETEERRFRLIARIRHDGEEDVVDKEQVNPEHYGIASTSYDGPLEETSRENELESAPLKDHTNVYHHGMSGIETKTVVEPTKGKKKAILHLKAGPSTTSETEEKPEIRLIARIAPDETETTPEKTSTKTRESSKRFGFLKSGARKSKTAVETSTYPVSDKYEGPLDDVEPLRDLENLPFENIPQVAYSPKKVVAVESSVSEPETEERRFRLIARIRHDGEEDVVDKEQVNPEHYGIASTSYDGPLEETSRENELESAPLKDHTNVYHHGMSGIETKTVVEPTKGKKKAILHLKAGPSTTSETEEKPEIRLIARIAPDETETTSEKTSTKTRESSKRFGFLKSGARKSKTAVETSTYPVSDKYEGPLDDVEPLRDLENLPFENIPQVAYSPKKVVAVESSVSEPETEERRFRLIARIRHDGEEDVVDKEQVNPEHYGIASTSYDGPLEETSRENELESAPLKDHTNVYHHGMSGIETKTVVEPTKGKKKAILHLKAGPSTTSETEEKPEIRLIARIAPDETETTPEKTSTKTRDSSKRFGFLKSGARKSKTAVETSTYPVSDKYEGPLDDVEPLRDLENLPFENIPQVAYSPKKVVAVESSVSEPETEERRFRLIARIRHDGEEDVVDKEQVNPEHYGIASTSYDGPLEETSRENELESAPLKDHTNVYHHGMSGIETKTVVEPTKGKKEAVLHLKAGPSTTSETEEKPEIRLIARIAPDETETTPEKTSTKTRESSKRFGFLKSGARKSKTAVETSTYPVSDKYEGPLDDVEPLRDLENLPFENIPQVAYSPKKVVAVESSVSEPETEERRFRLIARIRHDGEEDVVDKEQVNPEHYGIASTSYDGPLEETSRENELESAPLKDHTNVYHHGMSGIETKTVVEPTKGKKKAVLHLKAGPSTTSETEEKPEIRLIARIAPDETETTPEKTSTKTRESSKRFGFLKSGARKSKTAVETSTYPVSDKYEGPLDDVEPLRDLENLPFENIPQVAYSPKKVVAVESSVSEPETEERRFRLIARIRHDGEEDVVDKEQVNPEHYGIASTSYDGPLEETSRENELESAPLKDHTNVYHHGMSGIETKTVVEPTKGKKEAVLHLKAGPSTTSETEEKPEIRLIARIAPDETETTPEKTSTKTRESSKRFGFLKSGARKSKTAVETSTYPVSDKYEGPLDDVEPLRDLENLPFENIPQVAYSPKKVVAVESSVSEPETEERRFRLIARIRHDGEEDVVDKEQVNPEHYGIASTSYDGPLEETSRENELESAPLKDHTNVYHHGMSGIETKTVVEPTKGKKKAVLHLKAGPSTTSETEEKPEIRLIARIAPDETETTPEKTSTKTRESSKRFGFLKSGARKSKTAVETSTYPVSDKYEGPLDDVEPLRDLENLPFENIPQVAYSPKKVVAVESSVSEPETEERRFRLIARIRHDGEEDVVDKEQVNPEHYGIASTSYDGPLEETSRENELESAPLKDHTNVYHHGMSGIETKTVVEPTKGKKKAILHLKAGPSTTSETEEKPEIRLIARIAPDETETTPEKTSTKTRESSKRFGFLKSGARKSKTAVETSTYPVSDKYEGPLDDVEPLRDLENLPFENIPQVAYSPKKVVAVESSVSEPETEERRFRLIARIRHDGEEDVVDKEQVNPEHYGIASTSYDGPLEETSRENELESAPLKDHTNVYHHGMSGIETKTVVEPTKGKKKAILHLKAGPSTTSETEEKPEIRLIARIAPDETETTSEKTSTKTRESSKRFGFLKSGARKSKTAVETSTYPVSDKYEGPLDDVEPLRDLENLPFENIPQVAYSPKKVVAVESSVSEPETEERRFRLIARIRHDGEEDVVDKEQVNPEHYGIASTSYDGPLEETSRENELESAPLKDHTNVYHHGMSGIETKTVVEPTKGKKKAILHLKAGPSTTSETEEKPEIRLIARIAPDETETTPEKTSTKTRESSKRFGFLKSGARKSKTAVETSTYPVSDKYEGPLDDVEPLRDLENLPFENIPQVAYSPKKVVAVESSVSEPETEERRFRLIARIRHDGEEDVVDKEQVNPEHYGIASTSYDGPLEETSRENELESAPLKDHTNVYHHGMSGIETKTVVEPTKGKKKAILHLKAGPSTTSETEEKPEIRLIARIAPDETETTPEKTSTKTRESSKRFGFLKSGARKSKTAVETSTYPVSDKYEGPLDDVEPLRDLENLPFENIPQVAYSPKKVVAVESSVSEPETEERRFRLIARIRHDGEEDVVDKEQVNPEHYGIASTSYDGPLEETSRENELESAPLKDHTNVYHHGMSGIETKTVVEPTKGKKKAILHLKAGPSTTSETEEKPEIRLIARIAPDETETTSEKTSTKTRESSKRFGFLKSGARKSKTAVETSTYPVSDKYEGPLDDVEPLRDLENLPFENIPQVAYSPKKVVAVESSVSEPETEERRFRLIARIRHDGEEDVVDKEQVNPEHYGIASTSYDGPLEETSRENELESAPLKDHTNVYHHGMSGIETKTVVEPTKGKKKAILHLKAGPSTTSETEEKPEIRLIARIAPDETETTPEKTSTKTRESSKRFGFLKSGARKSKTAVETSTYPVSDKYEGPLDDVEPLRDLENLPFENIPQVAYSPKKVVAVESSVSEPETEERRFRLIARIRHDGEEDVVDKEQVNPEHYGIASTSYDGPLEETSRENELESAPLKDHTNVYHHGMSGIETKTVVEPTKGKKKAILHLKAGPSTTSETEEKPEIRLIARIAPDETETTPEKTSTKTRDSSKRFGFLKSGARNSKTAVETSTYPVSDKYEGPLDDVEPLVELESVPLSLIRSPVHNGDNRVSIHLPVKNRVISENDSTVDFNHRFSHQSYHSEGTTADGQQWIEVRVERRVEIQLVPVLCLSGAGLGAVSEDDGGLIFTASPPPMAPTGRSFLSRLGFKSKSKKSKGVKENDSSDSSSSEDEQKVVTVCPDAEDKKNGYRSSTHLADAKVVRRETNELKYHLKGEGLSSGFNPNDPESGQRHLTVSSWQETNILPDDVTVEYDEQGNKITRTVKTSQVKHTVQKQTFQNYIVPEDGLQEPVAVERVREQTTPLGHQKEGPMVETHTRTLTYEDKAEEDQNDALGEFVSSKTVTCGNRTIETITYKTEKDGIIETHVEHRVTIHSDAAIDYDSELSQAIQEATKMNPDMTVEKIEVRHETTN